MFINKRHLKRLAQTKKSKRELDKLVEDDDYGPIVTSPPDSGEGRISAYDKTWADMHDKRKKDG